MANWTTSSIASSIRKKLSLLTNWKEVVTTEGEYNNIIQSVSEGLYKLAYYADYWIANGTWFGATTFKAINDQAKSRSYYAHRKIGAVGYVKVGPDSTFDTASLAYTGANTVFSKWRQYSDPDSKRMVYITEQKVFKENTTIYNITLTAGSASNLGNGKVALPSTAHGLPVGTNISIIGTDSYDGFYIVLDTTTVNQIHINATYTEETFTGTEKVSGNYLFVPVKEGVPQEYIYTAKGEVNETFTLYDDSIENDLSIMEIYILDANDNPVYTVQVNGPDEDLYYVQDPDQWACQVTNTSDFTGVNFKFGDDVTSKGLTAGTRVLIKYATTEGADGDTTTLGYITVAVSPFVTVTGTEALLYFTNESAIVGGYDHETIDEVKRDALRLFYAGYRSDSAEDYQANVEKHPSIQKAFVYGWEDIGYGTVPVQGTERQNELYISGVTQTGESISSTLELDIRNNYIKYRSPLDVVIFEPLNKVGIKFITTAYVENIPQQEILTNMIDTLNNAYDILNVDFGENASWSKYTSDIQGVTGIISHDTTAYTVQEQETISKNFERISVSKTSVEISDAKKQIYLTQNTFEIWLRRKISDVWVDMIQIADSSGTNISGIGNYNVNGALNFTNNSMTYQLQDIIADTVPVGETGAGGSFGVRNPSVLDSDGYEVYLMYRTEDGNGNKNKDVRVASFNQIIDFNQVYLDVTFVYN